MSREEEIKKQMGRLSDELCEIRDKTSELKNSKLIGRCFKYRNSYSLPESEADKWWIYRRVLSVKAARVVVLDFQKDMLGKIEIEKHEVSMSGEKSGWTQITYMEFSEELCDLKQEIMLLDEQPELVE